MKALPQVLHLKGRLSTVLRQMRLQVGSGGCAEVTLVTLEIILQGVQSVGNSLSKSKSLGNISSYDIETKTKVLHGL